MSVPEAELSSILSRCTFVNGIVATVSGIFSNYLVEYTGSVKSPFMASFVCLVLAGLAIHHTWNENYGEEKSTVSIAAKDKQTNNGNGVASNGDPEALHPLMLDTIPEEGGHASSRTRSSADSGTMQAIRTILAGACSYCPFTCEVVSPLLTILPM